jgi:hypothetical protein
VVVLACSFPSCAYRLRVLNGLGSYFINIVVRSFEVLRLGCIQHWSLYSYFNLWSSKLVDIILLAIAANFRRVIKASEWNIDMILDSSFLGNFSIV